ncbi:YwdI family protein [Listeria aquatica]|uniref:YwdI family protein n=1 Tax=Listeria aquatica TaxID=1494960 RepID=UPI003EF3514F
MEVDIQVVFKKMEQELSSAKEASNETERKIHLSALKVLAEVLLTENEGKKAAVPEDLTWEKMTDSRPPQIQKEKSEKMDFEDGANGDSLFDF